MRAFVVLALVLAIGCEGTIGDSGFSTPETDVDPRTGEVRTASSRLHRLLDHQAAAILRETFAELDVELPLHLLPSNSMSGFFEVNDAPPDTDLVGAYLRFAEASGTIIASAVDCEERACVQDFVERTSSGLWRRTPSDEEVGAMMALLEAPEGVGDFSLRDGVRLQATVLLMSPQFWYRVEVGDPSDPNPADGLVQLSGEEIATRLSLLLWRQGPSDELLEAAAEGELDMPEGRSRWARTMLDDERAGRMAREFFTHLLELQHFGEQARYVPDTTEAESYPGLPQVAADMMEETLTFVTELMASEDSSFEELFTADYSFMSDELANYYGLAPGVASGSGPPRVALDFRRGLLSQGAVIGAHTTTETYRAAHRGRFILENLLCTELPAVELGAIPVPPAGLSPRETFEAMTVGECQACHVTLNGLGFLFENFDGGGRYARDWGEFEVDASGSMPSGQAVDGVVELGEALSTSDDASHCMAERMFEFVHGRPAAGGEEGAVDSAFAHFQESHLSLRELVVALVSSPTFAERRLPE